MPNMWQAWKSWHAHRKGEIGVEPKFHWPVRILCLEGRLLRLFWDAVDTGLVEGFNALALKENGRGLAGVGRVRRWTCRRNQFENSRMKSHRCLICIVGLKTPLVWPCWFLLVGKPRLFLVGKVEQKSSYAETWWETKLDSCRTDCWEWKWTQIRIRVSECPGIIKPKRWRSKMTMSQN